MWINILAGFDRSHALPVLDDLFLHKFIESLENKIPSERGEAIRESQVILPFAFNHRPLTT